MQLTTVYLVLTEVWPFLFRSDLNHDQHAGPCSFYVDEETV